MFFLVRSNLSLRMVLRSLCIITLCIFGNADTDFIEAAIQRGFKRHAQYPALLDQRFRNNSQSQIVGHAGGQWTSTTHLMEYGMNVDAGLMLVLEGACSMYDKDINKACSVLEFGSGLGLYSAYLKKHSRRHVVAIEPEPMGGAFSGRNSPLQSTVNIFDHNPSEYANIVKSISGPFMLVFSIEVLEHVPLEKHNNAASFFATASTKESTLVFSAGAPNQKGYGHIGGRNASSWRSILENVGFIFSHRGTLAAKAHVDTFNVNHVKNIMVFYRDFDAGKAKDPFMKEIPMFKNKGKNNIESGKHLTASSSWKWVLGK